MARFSDGIDPELVDLVGHDEVPSKEEVNKTSLDQLDKMFCFEDSTYPEIAALAKTPKSAPAEDPERKITKEEAKDFVNKVYAAVGTRQ